MATYRVNSSLWDIIISVLVVLYIMGVLFSGDNFIINILYVRTCIFVYIEGYL